MAEDGDQDDEDDVADWPVETIRAKWTMDGATTLAEAAVKLRRYADYLERLKGDGWELTQPVVDDYGWIENDDRTKRLSVRIS